MKIKIIIIIAAICFAIIPMVARVFLTDYFIKKDSSEQYRKEVTSMASNQTSAMQAMLDTAKSDLNTVTSYAPLRSAASSGSFDDDTKDFVKQLMEGNVMISSVKVIGSDGVVLAGDGEGRSVPNFSQYAGYSDGALYFDAVASGADKDKMNSMFIKQRVGVCTVMISYDTKESNALISKALSNTGFDTSGKAEGRVVIVDSKGNWSAGSGLFYEKENLDSTYTSAVTSKIASLSDNAVSEVIAYQNGNTNSLAALVKVGGENGLVAIASCLDSMNGSFYGSAIPPIYVAAILLAIVSIIAAVIASNTIISPLKKIQETLDKIRRGDHEARIGTISNNEYGQLSRSFNSLVDEIVVSEDRYKTISDMSDNIIFEWNFKTNEVVFSNNFNKKFSYRAPSDHFGDSFLLKAKLHPDDVDRYRNDLDALEKGKNFERNEYRMKNIYGDFIWVLMRTATLNGSDGKPSKVVGVMLDIDRAKKSEQQLTERASYDALTELYNRETIETQIDNEISLSEMRKTEMAVLFIDVDDFKHFNDNYSHATGDQVLKFVAKTIKQTVGDAGFAGRYGGDEFIAMIRNAETNAPAEIAQKIIDTLAAGFDADIGEKLSVSCSIGIAVIKDDYNTRVEYLIGKADDAMYSVKKSGKANYAFI